MHNSAEHIIIVGITCFSALITGSSAIIIAPSEADFQLHIARTPSKFLAKLLICTFWRVASDILISAT